MWTLPTVRAKDSWKSTTWGCIYTSHALVSHTLLIHLHLAHSHHLPKWTNCDISHVHIPHLPISRIQMCFYHHLLRIKIAKGGPLNKQFASAMIHTLQKKNVPMLLFANAAVHLVLAKVHHLDSFRMVWNFLGYILNDAWMLGSALPEIIRDAESLRKAKALWHLSESINSSILNEQVLMQLYINII